MTELVDFKAVAFMPCEHMTFAFYPKAKTIHRSFMDSFAFLERSLSHLGFAETQRVLVSPHLPDTWLFWYLTGKTPWDVYAFDLTFASFPVPMTALILPIICVHQPHPEVDFWQLQVDHVFSAITLNQLNKNALNLIILLHEGEGCPQSTDLLRVKTGFHYTAEDGTTAETLHDLITISAPNKIRFIECDLSKGESPGKINAALNTSPKL